MSKTFILSSVRHFLYMGRIISKTKVVNFSYNKGKCGTVHLILGVILICLPCFVETSKARSEAIPECDGSLFVAPKLLVQNVPMSASFLFQSSNCRDKRISERICRNDKSIPSTAPQGKPVINENTRQGDDSGDKGDGNGGWHDYIGLSSLILIAWLILFRSNVRVQGASGFVWGFFIEREPG